MNIFALGVIRRLLMAIKEHKSLERKQKLSPRWPTCHRSKFLRRQEEIFTAHRRKEMPFFPPLTSSSGFNNGGFFLKKLVMSSCLQQYFMVFGFRPTAGNPIITHTQKKNTFIGVHNKSIFIYQNQSCMDVKEVVLYIVRYFCKLIK